AAGLPAIADLAAGQRAGRVMAALGIGGRDAGNGDLVGPAGPCRSAAVTGEKYSGLATATGTPFDQASATRWGAAVGTGVEVGFANNWSIAAEYEHLFMGNRTLTFSGVPGGAATRTDAVGQDVDMATVRVNYRWGGPVVSKH
ncbi:outer membrane protein, partial [Bradyrhizobium sp.]|uniref:outer membrane protein n=1 Tax=Bradyrhizobium sp. TaxID=376 RepID=UPI00391CFBE7